MPDIHAERGALLLRQTSNAHEIEACQRLRYEVFYEELGALPVDDMASSRMDADRFDAICDHLVVVRRDAAEGAGAIMLEDGELIGTYRLLRQEVAETHGGFYTSGEFDESDPDLGRGTRWLLRWPTPLSARSSIRS